MSNQLNNIIPEWILRRLPYNHYNINVDGKNMHVMEKGKGRPIVLVHGNPMWGYLYKKVFGIKYPGPFFFFNEIMM